MEFIKNYFKRKKIERSVWRRVESLDDFMRRNWKNPDYTYEIIGLETKRWNLRDDNDGDFMLEHGRQVRGDLIQLFQINEVGEAIEIGGWVDQTHAYGFIGIGDISINTKLTLEQIESMVRNYESKH